MDKDFQPSGKLIPEPPAEMGSGFLSHYWSSRDALPVIRGPEVWWYYLQRGVRTVTALPTSSVISVMTIAISLFLLAGFLLMLQNIGRVLEDAGSTLYLTAYVRPDAQDKDVADFIRELEGNPRVRSVQYTSKQKALDEFRQDLGMHGSLLEGLENSNPLPASIDIVLRPDVVQTTSPEEIANQLRKVAVVDDIVFGSEWVERMSGVVKVFRGFALITLLTAMAVIIFLISNTIKLVIYSRREEIAIMKLVGASDGFVKIPFMIGGMIQGLIGSIIGLLLLKGGASLLNLQLHSSQILGTTLPELSFLSGWSLCALVVLGLAVGAIGSFFALGKFINV